MGSWFSGRRSIAANSRRASKKESPTLPRAMLVIAFFGRRFPTTPLSAAPNSGITGTSQSIIPLLAEEGAKRKPDRAKPQEKLRRAKRSRRRGGQIG